MIGETGVRSLDRAREEYLRHMSFVSKFECEKYFVYRQIYLYPDTIKTKRKLNWNIKRITVKI